MRNSNLNHAKIFKNQKFKKKGFFSGFPPGCNFLGGISCLFFMFVLRFLKGDKNTFKKGNNDT